MSPKKTSNTSSGAVKSLNCSPNRVSGIFKSQNSPKTKKKVETSQQIEEIPQKRTFISGFEKKLVEDVKNGSIDLSAARNTLKQIKSFKAPFKESAQNNTLLENKEEIEVDPNLKNIEKHLIEAIESEIIARLDPIEWEDVAGLGFAKETIKEIAILPLLKPHLFKGLRSPPKGLSQKVFFELFMICWDRYPIIRSSRHWKDIFRPFGRLSDKVDILFDNSVGAEQQMDRRGGEDYPSDVRRRPFPTAVRYIY